MLLNVAVQMDPIEKVNVKGDSTFAMMLEAQRRGHTLFYYQTKTLALASGILSATGHDVRVKDEASNFYSLGEEERVNLSDYDVVLMRQDPPFDMGYITATHMLDHIHPRTLVVNDPTEVRNAPEKLFVLNYREFMPAMLITRDASELAAFRMQHEDIIIKPPMAMAALVCSGSGAATRILLRFWRSSAAPFPISPISRRNICPMCGKATSASSLSTENLRAPSTGFPPPMKPAPTCMWGAGRSLRR